MMTPWVTKGQSSGKWCKGVGEEATSAWPWGTAGAPGGGQGQQGVDWWDRQDDSYAAKHCCAGAGESRGWVGGW